MRSSPRQARRSSARRPAATKARSRRCWRSISPARNCSSSTRRLRRSRAAPTPSELQNSRMATTLAPAEVEVEQPTADDDAEHDRPWIVIVWNGNREKAELDVARLPAYGLWATMQRD